MCSLAYNRCLSAVGEQDGGSRVSRDADGEHEIIALDAPVGFDVAYATATPCEVTDWVRGDGDIVALATDAEEVGNEEIIDVAHHKVIHGSTKLGIPLLRKGSITQFDLITIAWHVVVVEHLVEQLLLPIVNESIEEITVADVARSQTVTMGMDISDEILHDGLFMLSADVQEKG